MLTFMHCSSLRTEFFKTMLKKTYMKVRQISLDTPPAWGSDTAGDNTEGSLDDENVHCENVCSNVTEYYRGPHCWHTRVMSIEVLGTLRVSLAIPWCPVYPVLSWYRPWSPPRSALQWYCVCECGHRSLPPVLPGDQCHRCPPPGHGGPSHGGHLTYHLMIINKNAAIVQMGTLDTKTGRSDPTWPDTYHIHIPYML